MHRGDPMSVAGVFNDAGLVAELAIRDRLKKAVEERQMYLSLCVAFLKREGGETNIKQEELLCDGTVWLSLGEDKESFDVWYEQNEEKQLEGGDDEEMD
jgi:hypothetical protein